MSPDSDAVAVIGYAGRFPGARDVDELWANLESGVDSVVALSDADLDEAGVSTEARARPGYVRAALPLAGVAEFDAEFFGISPGEAEILDPQQRIFLETAWETFEHAGHVPSDIPGQVGVFASTGMSTYLLDHVLPAYGRADLALSYQMKLGNDKDFLASRVSYKFGLTGPSIVVQSACSSSLVAVHLAAQSLLDAECDAALAGGVSLSLPQRAGYQFQAGMILSPDGRCRPFDAEAKGTVRGNGAGAVLLKRLSDALADGDTVHAVIRGSAVNNDGSGKLGYTAPHEVAQREAVLQAQAIAGVHPSTVTYVEAHGTGTELGDPVEFAALDAAFRAGTDKRGFCALGSVKGNIGHLDVAAGVTGLIKVLLMLRHRRIPPMAHFQAPNPRIDLAGSPFYVNTEPRAWRGGDGPLRAGLSSTGIGGTNVHVIVEEAPAQPGETAHDEPQLLVVSARSPAALDAACDRVAARFRADPDQDLLDVATSLRAGRVAHAHRRTVVARSASTAADAFERRTPEAATTGSVADGEHRVAFLFPGQGAQRLHMGRTLAGAEPAFRAAAEECMALFTSHLGEDLRAVMWPDGDAGSDERLRGTAFAQPALFTVEYAMATLWESRGVTPAAMLGHSVGEFVAACLAGVVDLPAATWLVARRGQLMRSAPAGAMLAVSLPADDVTDLLPAGVDLAAVNAADRCVVSGPTGLVAAFRTRLADRGVDVRELRTSHAFHSAAMESILGEFAADVARLDLRPPRIPFVSNVSGDWLSPDDAVSPEYWARHLRLPVRFHTGLGAVYESGVTAVVECGPGNELTNLARRHPARIGVVTPSVSRDGADDPAASLRALGALWSVGVPVRWDALRQGRRVPVPSYPFERKRFWLTPTPQSTGERHTDCVTYLPAWRRAAPAAPGPDHRSSWALVGDHPVVDQVAGRLRALGHQATVLARPDNATHHDHVVDLTGLGAVDRDDARLALTRFTATLNAVRGAQGPLRYWLVANGIHRVESADRVVMDTAPLPGLLAVAQQEVPGLRTHVVDVPSTDVDVAMLVAELTAAQPSPVVAHRGGWRLLPAFEPWEPVAAAPSPGGAYLITGGLGRLGLVLADHLVRTRGATVVLTTRSEAPDVRGTAELGGAVRVRRADVTSEDDMRSVVAWCEREFGGLRGVIHAAGVAGVRAARTFRQLSEETDEEQFAAKVAGTRVLRRVLAGTSVDFCLLMSSTAAIFGGPGLGAYAAANGYLDAVADGADSGGTRWLSVNWDRWLIPGHQSTNGLPVDRALRALDQVLSAPIRGRVAVCAGSPADQWVEWRERRTAGELVEAQAPDLAEGLAAVVTGVWQRILGVATVGPDDNFFELGGDSLIALRVVAELERVLAREIPVVLFYEGPTVRSLCALLDDVDRDGGELAEETERAARRRRHLRGRRGVGGSHHG